MQLIKKFINNPKFPIITIVLVWLFSVLPSAINSNWFFLDDPQTVVFGSKISMNLDFFIPTSFFGRYVPLYWYYRGFVFRLFGNTPMPSYLLQAAFVLITLLLIFWIVKRLTSSKWAGLFSSLIFITGSGVAENFYTLGKPETIVLMSLLIVISLCIKLLSENKKWRKIIFFILICIFILIAVWNKEPGILVIILGIGFLLRAFWPRGKKDKKYLLPGMAILFGVFLSRLPQIIFHPSNANSLYTDYHIGWTLIKTNIITYWEQNPDYFILITLTLLLAFFLLFKLYGHKKLRKLKINYTFSLLILILSLSFWAVLIVWRWPMGYYTYISAGLVSIPFGIFLYQCFFVIKIFNIKVFGTIILIILFTRIVSIPYNLYTGVAQYTLNFIYSSAIKDFENKAPLNSHLFVENWDFYGEEISETNLLLKEIDNRPDLSSDGIADLIENRKIPDEVLKLYGWDSPPDAVNRWPKLNDYILVFTANLDTVWRVRGLMPMVKSDSILPAKGYELELMGDSESDYYLPFLETAGQSVKWKIGKTFQGYKLYKVMKVPADFSNLYNP